MAMSLPCFLADFSSMQTKHKFWKENAEKVCDDEEDIHGKIAIVTGSNAGIGKLMAMQLAKRGAVVIMAVRNMEKGQEALEDIKKQAGEDAKLELMKLDLGDKQSVRNFVKEFQGKYSHLNILINNAGLMDTTGVLKKTADGSEQQIATNHLGSFLLVNLLLDSLKKGAPSRAICVQTSNVALAKFDLDDWMMEKKIKTGNSGMAQYDLSKLCSALCMLKLAKSNQGSGVKFFQMCPGIVKTNMLGGGVSGGGVVNRIMSSVISNTVALSPHEGSETAVFLAVSKGVAEPDESGKGEMYRFTQFWKEGNKTLNDYFTSDPEKIETLYKMSEELVGLPEKS